MIPILDHIVEKAREQEIFSREDTPTEERVRAAFLYHLGLSYRKVGRDFLTKPSVSGITNSLTYSILNQTRTKLLRLTRQKLGSKIRRCTRGQLSMSIRSKPSM